MATLTEQLAAEKAAHAATRNEVMPGQERSVLNRNLDDVVAAAQEQAANAAASKLACGKARAAELGAKEECAEYIAVIAAVQTYLNVTTTINLSRLRTAFNILTAEAVE